MPITTPRPAVHISTTEQHGIFWLRREPRAIREKPDLRGHRENRVRQERQALQSHGRVVFQKRLQVLYSTGHTSILETAAHIYTTELAGHFLQPRVPKVKLELLEHKARPVHKDLRARREKRELTE